MASPNDIQTSIRISSEIDDAIQDEVRRRIEHLDIDHQDAARLITRSYVIRKALLAGLEVISQEDDVPRRTTA